MLTPVANVAVGIDSMLGWGITTAANNVAVDAYALPYITTGNNNTALGYKAGYSNTTGFNNVFVGYESGQGVTTGVYNTLLGVNTVTGQNCVTTGLQNIEIGFEVCVPSPTTSGQLAIGNFIYGTGLTGTGSTVSPGKIGIGTSTPYSRLTLWGTDAVASTAAFTIANSASTTELQVFDDGHAVLAGALTQSSDQRLKTNVQSLDASSSLAAIESLNPVSFNWVGNMFGSGNQLGFIAQQVEQQFPDLVSTTSPTALTRGGTLGLNYTGLIAPIVGAIKALAAEVSSLSATVAGFAQRFTTQEADVQKLCVGSTCVTPAQFQAIVAAAGQQSAAAPSADQPASPSTGATSTPATSTPALPPPAQQAADTTAPAPSGEGSDASPAPTPTPASGPTADTTAPAN
jgi:hypothetical protein